MPLSQPLDQEAKREPPTWTDWERPWTRAGGRAKGYTQPTRNIEPGMTVALRSATKPYLPTFAPWWLGLVVRSVDADGVRFDNAPKLVATFDEFPLLTHWAIRAAAEPPAPEEP